MTPRRQGDPPHGEQVVHREMDAHPEHEEDDPDLGELLGECDIGHEARRERPHGDARHEVAHQRRKAEPDGQHPQREGEREAGRDGDDERGLVRHGPKRNR